MRWRILTKAAARSVLGAALLAQVALAAQACNMPVFRPVAAFSGAATMPDCEQAQAPVSVVCLVHCLQADQVVGSPHDLVAAPPATSPASRLPLAAAATSGHPPDAAALPTGPPVYLRSRRLLL